jgi:amino acid transporter
MAGPSRRRENGSAFTVEESDEIPTVAVADVTCNNIVSAEDLTTLNTVLGNPRCQSRSNWWAWVLGAILLIFLVLLLIGWAIPATRFGWIILLVIFIILLIAVVFGSCRTTVPLCRA